jgi:predicted DNA-binding transcriptional regulator YafY
VKCNSSTRLRPSSALPISSKKRALTGRRQVSPQRLTHYRNTWYLDAWCHRSDGLRRFALDAVRDAAMLPQAAKEVALSIVTAELDGGYGVFAGRKLKWAVLCFSAEAAQWVATEQWHPQQQTRWLADGSLQLRLPYADSTELSMDILRHGDQVRVLSPKELAKQVAERLRSAAQQYALSNAADAARGG